MESLTQLIGFSSHFRESFVYLFSFAQRCWRKCLIFSHVQCDVHHWSVVAEIWQMTHLVTAFHDCQSYTDRPEETIRMLNGLHVILQIQSFVVYDMLTDVLVYQLLPQLPSIAHRGIWQLQGVQWLMHWSHSWGNACVQLCVFQHLIRKKKKIFIPITYHTGFSRHSI